MRHSRAHEKRAHSSAFRPMPQRHTPRSAVESHYDGQANLSIPRGAYMQQRKSGPLIKYKEFLKKEEEESERFSRLKV